MSLRDLAAGLDDSAQEHAIARDVEAELAAHLELAAEALEAEGAHPEEARALARERFGDLGRIRRQCLRIRLGGNHAMKIALLVSNLVLVAALMASLFVARAQHVRAQEAMERALEAQALALEVADRERAAAPAPVEHVVVEVGDSIDVVETYHQGDFPAPSVVQPDGQALFPSVGWIEVAGLTRRDLEERLREVYAPLYEELDLHAVVRKSAQPGTLAALLAGRPAAPSGMVVAAVGDVIEILDRHRQHDFSEQVRVEADGKVLLHHLGWVAVEGLDRDQLAASLTEAYAPYYADLVVDVVIHKDP